MRARCPFRRSAPSHQHHSGWIQTSLPATAVFTRLRDIAFTRTLVSQMRSVVRKSYLSRIYPKFSCGASDWELTFHFDCGIRIWRHVKRVDAHVFPRVIRPWFIDSATKKKRKEKTFLYIINFIVLVSWLISRQVNEVAYFRSAVISLDCNCESLGGLTKPGEGDILAWCC